MERQKHYGLIGINRYLRFRKAKKFATGRTLDVGCSDGAFLSLFGESNDVIGIDVSKGRLEIAKTFGKVICASVEYLPFNSETFSSVVALEIIEHVEQKEQALSEMVRVLKRGGTLIISFPTKPFKGHPEYLSRKDFQEMIKNKNLEALYLDYLPLSSPILTSFDSERDMPKFRKKWYFKIFLLLRPLLRQLFTIYGKIQKADIFIVMKNC